MKPELILNTKMRWCLTLVVLSLFSCHYKQDSFLLFNHQSINTVYIQPLEVLPSSHITYLAQEIRNYQPHVVVLQPIHLPQQAWYDPRKRYRADSLIQWLKNRVKNGEVIIGITSKDISTTKNSIKDFGVMGLGFTPGKSCVVSTFRLKKQNVRQQLFKVSIHELGHTQGLNHCSNKNCFMRDAEGGNPTDEETGFCINCRKFLVQRGWTL